MSDSEDLVYYKENIDNPRADKNIAWGSVPTNTRSIRAAIAKSVLDFPNRCDRLTVDDFVEGRWKNPDTENVIRKQFLALSDEDKVAILRMSENAGLCQELAPHFAAYLRAKKNGHSDFIHIFKKSWLESDPTRNTQEPSQQTTSLSSKDYSITHELARGYNTVYARSADIHLSVSLSLAPFFRRDIEERFPEICDSDIWHELVGFDVLGRGVLDLKAPNGAAVKRPGSVLFSYDEEERKLEKIGASAKFFEDCLITNI